MAIYHLSVKPISRSAGRSATAAAAYRAGEKITDERTGAIHDYTRKGGVESADLVLPAGAPAWAADRAALWNAAELAEKRKDACVAREFEVALPSELSPPERRRLALDFARDMANREGCAVDVAIHAPGKEGDHRNHHAHILRTTRKVEADGLGAKLDTEKAGRKRSDDLEAVRERWAELVNARLREAGLEARVDHRTLEAQGAGHEATQHLGPAASGFERRTGQPCDKRIQWEQETAERMARAQALGDLERQGAELDRSILDLSGDMQAALAERDRLQAERAKAEQEQAQAAARAAEQARRADPTTTLAAWSALPPIALRGSMEGIPRQNVLATLCNHQTDSLPLTALLGEAEQTALRQAGWLDHAGDLTPKGQSAVQWHQAQQAERDKAERAQAEQEQAQAAARAAEREQQRRAEQDRRAAEQAAEQARLDAQTAAGTIDGLRAPRRSADAWQQWRAHVLTQAYGDQVEAAELARHWRVRLPREGQPLTLWGDAGRRIDDLGDRICPGAAPGVPLHDFTLRTALQLAQLKGWDQGKGLDITGSATFRERAARMATSMGIPVANTELQAIVADERAKQRAPRPAERLAALPTETVDRSAPHAAQPAPAQERPAVPEKQAHQPNPIREEAIAFLGENPAERQRRWDDLVKRTSAPPQRQQHLDDPKAALAAWQNDRTQRGLPNAGTARVHERCTREGWRASTAEDIRNDWQRQVDETEQRRDQLEQSGRRLLRRNRHENEVAKLHAQALQMVKDGTAQHDLARDWEAFKPQCIAQEHSQRLDAWKKAAALQQRIAPHVSAILEQDRVQRAAEQDKVKEAKRQRPQQRKSPSPGGGIGD